MNVGHMVVSVPLVLGVNAEVRMNVFAIRAAPRHDTAGLVASSGFDVLDIHFFMAAWTRDCLELVVRHRVSLENIAVGWHRDNRGAYGKQSTVHILL